MEIYLKAMMIFFKSWKLMASMELIFFPFFYLLYFFCDLFLTPLLHDDFSQRSSNHDIDPISPYGFMIIELILIIIYWLLVFFFFSIATIQSSSMSLVSSKEDITMKNLLLKLRSTCWKGSIITYISNTTILMGLVDICLVSLKIHVSTTWEPMIFLGSILGFLGVCLLFLGFVISVVEDDCYGFKALVRTYEVVKEKGVQLLAVIPIRFIISRVLVSTFADLKHSDMEGSQFLAAVFLAIGSTALEMFILAVYVVSYHRTLKNQKNRKNKLEMKYEKLSQVNELLL